MKSTLTLRAKTQRGDVRMNVAPAPTAPDDMEDLLTSGQIAVVFAEGRISKVIDEEALTVVLGDACAAVVGKIEGTTLENAYRDLMDAKQAERLDSDDVAFLGRIEELVIEHGLRSSVVGHEAVFAEMLLRAIRRSVELMVNS